MYVRLIDGKGGKTLGDVLCDVCGEQIDLDEDCVYLTPRAHIELEAAITHKMCSRRPGRFTDHWSQITRPRYILESVLETSQRHPALAGFLRTLRKRKPAE